MKLPKWLDELLEYINNNMNLIMKSIIAAVLIVAGPVISILLRMEGESYGVIILVGLIFEVVGVLLFVLFVRKDLDKEESRHLSNQKQNIKEKREIPKTI